MKIEIAESICPFCQKNNNCMAHSKEPCWCKDVKVPEELSALVPDDKKRKVCICKSCIEAFHNNSEDFIKKYS